MGEGNSNVECLQELAFPPLSSSHGRSLRVSPWGASCPTLSASSGMPAPGAVGPGGAAVMGGAANASAPLCTLLVQCLIQ